MLAANIPFGDMQRTSSCNTMVVDTNDKQAACELIIFISWPTCRANYNDINKLHGLPCARRRWPSFDS